MPENKSGRAAFWDPSFAHNTASVLQTNSQQSTINIQQPRTLFTSIGARGAKVSQPW
jgi:hypothetical protein